VGQKVWKGPTLVGRKMENKWRKRPHHFPHFSSLLSLSVKFGELSLLRNNKKKIIVVEKKRQSKKAAVTEK